MGVLNRIVASLHGVAVDGRSSEEVSWPAPSQPQEGVPSASSVQTQASLPSLPAYVDESIFSEFLSRQGSVLERMEEMVLGLEKDQDPEMLKEFRRLVHTLKGEAAVLGLDDVEKLCHSTEDAVDAQGIPSLTDALLTVKDWLGRAFAWYAGKGAAPCAVEETMQNLQVKLVTVEQSQGPRRTLQPRPQ